MKTEEVKLRSFEEYLDEKVNAKQRWLLKFSVREWCEYANEHSFQQVTAATEEIKRERDEYYDTLQEYRLKTADMEKRIQELEAHVPKWISVDERLPERAELTDDNLVLVDSCLYAGIMVCEYKGAKFIDPIDGSNITEYITRWMSIPQPLK